MFFNLREKDKFLTGMAYDLNDLKELLKYV
jgi:hypothetical protein